MLWKENAFICTFHTLRVNTGFIITHPKLNKLVKKLSRGAVEVEEEDLIEERWVSGLLDSRLFGLIVASEAGNGTDVSSGQLSRFNDFDTNLKLK